MNYILTAEGRRVNIPKYCSRYDHEFFDPLSAFHKNPRHKDGLQSLCKSCTRADNRRYKLEHAGKGATYGITGKELEQLVSRQIAHLQQLCV